MRRTYLGDGVHARTNSGGWLVLEEGDPLRPDRGLRNVEQRVTLSPSALNALMRELEADSWARGVAEGKARIAAGGPAKGPDGES